ncbi:PREDICTED: butyrophilin subfamily 1 member A1-like [Gekko japonicus]|uniref:Butyrophilin subfamily 1 member A1-like n=1 Tax=Gekko japonicus TaxID=146911 RepID=A0ABM1KIX0_GEKJA|nr:PREDICTED: butyrophilin subfamily 1 member A1-like [Gekko japonicus]
MNNTNARQSFGSFISHKLRRLSNEGGVPRLLEDEGLEGEQERDPDTAHPGLILSEGQKSVRDGEKTQALPNNPERFDTFGAVLGREGFPAGRHFWEVLVGSEGEWAVGVARKSVRRKGGITFSPEEGFWEVGKWGGRFRASEKDPDPFEALTRELKRIRVCLNYTGCRVAFFDADRAALLYEFCGASFSGETLLPFFWLHSKGHLEIS